jgi:hypothetical protein
MFSNVSLLPPKPANHPTLTQAGTPYLIRYFVDGVATTVAVSTVSLSGIKQYQEYANFPPNTTLECETTTYLGDTWIRPLGQDKALNIKTGKFCILDYTPDPDEIISIEL